MKRFFSLLIAALGVFVFSLPALAEGESAGIHTCPLCGICPAPLGICVFLYLIIALVIVIIALFISGLGKRCPICHARCKRKDYRCAKCGYDFESGLQSTMSIRVADSPELMALRQEEDALLEDTAEFDAAELREQLAETQVSQDTPETDIIHCPVCGAELPKVAMFCGKCGRRLS